MNNKNPWLESAERHKNSAKSMMESNHRDWGLFVWHLAIEKLLKGAIHEENKEIPFIHDLTKLAQQTNINFTEKQLDQLDEITTFNLEARYDDYKFAFYKKATKEYSQKWNKICEDLFTHIKRHYDIKQKS